MPTSIKIPTPSAAPKGPEPEAPPLVGSEPGPLLSYTLGRLRPRFIDLGAWHELGSLIPEPPPRPGTDDLERVIKRVFAPMARAVDPLPSIWRGSWCGRCKTPSG